MSVRLPAGPSLRVLLALVVAVLFIHGWLLLGAASPLSLRLPASVPATVNAPVQLRVVTPAPASGRFEPAGAQRPVRSAQPPNHAGSAEALAVAEAPQAAASEVHAPKADVPDVPATPGEPMAPVASKTKAAAEAPAPEAPLPTPTQAQAQPEAAQPALTALPLISLGALPPSRVLSYQLSGMEKGLNYHASGELRWQHNDTAYELTLTVRAFLLGSRHWRSVGQIDATGLAPRRFSDIWRNERAAHFDREQQRIVFSSNSTPAPWQPGAQDQVSLYVQLAAAMAGEPERFVPGTRLQVQTATVRDAQPWALVLEGAQPQTVDGQPQRTLKWVAQPRHQYATRVEFWVAQSLAWMPVRIRITQASGSYIDLALSGSDPLPPLPVAADKTTGAKGS